ncbi:sigma-54-dependent transcriptional regulator [Sulfuriferula nivalis]|uniref:Sigma-54-dependent Fis family transcriptional regulator n=1 Tax=Sulfuriferula nivalis TaxID=2675298 RepID=A0A809SI81_9PROT|nr:sigma-54 dependent transcriptional regulator [Sulfuriferula nivalis]BBP01530.1 sigma-54-dependent Fis family transcriptional regulator [Sulfuriferula nivalis]
MLDRTVLIIDDESDILELLEISLIRMGLDVVKAETVAQAQAAIEQQKFALCLTDMRLPDGDGLEIVRFIQQAQPTLPVAVLTAHGNTDNAVTALKAGAFDYINKPVTLEQLRALVKSALKMPENTTLAMQGLVGNSPAMQQARELIGKLARTQAPVYITGESGSGKELAARLIHQQSNRAAMPFVPVNCGAIPENLMESEFFGYKKGAFTGADSERDGFFQAAQGGTIFLDEVADLPLAMQVKLLRVIQEKKVRKLGSSVEEPIDVRIISATHQNLAQCVEAGRFRQDLFYRLNVISLKMPALRDMREDVASVAQTLLTRLAQEAGMPVPVLNASALTALAQYDFPGNVRELENILERALALTSGDSIAATDLHLTPVVDELLPERVAGAKWPLQDYLDGVEREAIEEALVQTRYNKTAAAKLLGITFRALRYRLERLNIE